jgi:AraC-like DNA-binding protein
MRRGTQQAAELVGRVKSRAVDVVASQAFEGSPDFPEKLQTFRALMLGDGNADPVPQGGTQQINPMVAEPSAPPVEAVPTVTDGTVNGDPVPLCGRTTDNDKLTIKELCGQFSVSRRCLMRLFAQHEGCSPGAWVRAVRLEAARMLREDGRSFRIVADRLGYSSRSSIWRLVRRGRVPKTSGELPH